MKQFNEESICPKCGHDQISSSWNWQYETPFDFSVKVEYIERCCHRCNYQWNEIPLDADKKRNKTN